jgi:hypothetical protein
MRVRKSAVARLAARHLPQEIAPYDILCQVTRLNAGNRFDIDGHAFVEPCIVAGKPGETGMDHLMDHDPVIRHEVIDGRQVPYPHRNGHRFPRIGTSAADTLAGRAYYCDPHARDRKLAEIGADRISRLSHPVLDRFILQEERSTGDGEVDAAAMDLERLGRARRAHQAEDRSNNEKDGRAERGTDVHDKPSQKRDRIGQIVSVRSGQLFTKSIGSLPPLS